MSRLVEAGKAAETSSQHLHERVLWEGFNMENTEAAVRRLTAGWKFLPPVDVVPSHADLPVPADEGVEGLYIRGRVFVVDRGDGARAARVLGHELTHHATRAAMGRGWRTFMASVIDGQRAGDDTLTIARKHVQWAYAVDELSPIRQGDEVIAHLAEQRINPQTGRFEVPHPLRSQLLAAWRHFARERLLLSIPATALEADGALLLLEDRLRRGRPLWDFGGWCYSGDMPSKPLGANPPPRNLAESERWLRAASSGVKIGWKDRLALWGMGVVGFAAIVYLLVAVFSTTIWFAGPAAGIVGGLIFLWFFFRQD